MSGDKNLWTLPDGVNEITLELALPLENLRRRILDEFKVWGYDLVFPPLIEFLDSILTGSSTELDLQTFKLTDQLSGRLMGVRADMTPQVARIDAHVRKKDAPDRLCYLGPVLRAKTHGVGASRTPIQLGAELFGHDGLASDTEIVKLMLTILKIAGIDKLHLDIGHVGIFRAIMDRVQLEDADKTKIRDMLQRKDSSELKEFLSTVKIDKKTSDMLQALPMLCGETEILLQAKDIFDMKNTEIAKALDDIESLADAVKTDGISIVYDLSELRGYSYHTGLVFAVYVEGKGSSIAKGGRYDEIGKSFGRARAATGFSADLVELVRLSGKTYEKQAIFAPFVQGDDRLVAVISKLRQDGEIVICELPEQVGDAPDMSCNRKLVLKAGNWEIQDLT